MSSVFIFTPGRAVIDFQVLPKVVKQVNLDVDEGSHNHTTTSKTITYRYGTGHSTSGSWTNPSSAYDDNDATYAYEFSMTNSDHITITFNETDLGTVEYRRVTFTYSYEQLGSVTAEVRIGTESYKTFPYTAASGAGPIPQTISKIWYGDSWDLDVRFTGSSGTGVPDFHLYEVVVEVSYTPTIANSAATGVALSGNSSADTVIGGAVSADVTGLVDISGAFTRSLNAAIERPHHVFLYMARRLLNIAAGLIGHWAFDEGSGTLAGDSSGREVHGTLKGTPATWEAGKLAYALHFDGAADYVECGASKLYDFTSEDFSISFWINPDTLTTNHRIISRGNHQVDGWEVLQTLRTHPLTKSLPVIICSVINDPELAYSLGASLIVPKPVRRDDILAALRELEII